LRVVVQSKWLAFSGAVFILAGATRIAQWSMQGFAPSQGPSMPEATGLHALVSGLVVALVGGCIIFRTVELKRDRAESPESSRHASPRK